MTVRLYIIEFGTGDVNSVEDSTTLTEVDIDNVCGGGGVVIVNVDTGGSRDPCAVREGNVGYRIGEIP
jgi:hypothetical protein